MLGDVRNTLLEYELARGGIDAEIRTLVNTVELIAVDQTQRLSDLRNIVGSRVVAVPARIDIHARGAVGQRTQFVAG